MPTPGVVVIGAGQAAVQLAASLRQGGYAEPITLVGDEPGLPYQRPPLSKAYMTGQMDEAGLLLRPGTDVHGHQHPRFARGRRAAGVMADVGTTPATAAARLPQRARKRAHVGAHAGGDRQHEQRT